ncbi:MAG: saccharopine dehydrogenase [Gemmatimonadales bacterium]|nr:Lysine 6-dehydrogenase [bacterium HR33]GIW52072.1 MAG: saccharopine dehydrogenase [Gemmatimonadales bacterium]
MNILVLGSGLQGSACAFDLLSTTSYKVTIADAAPERLPDFLKPYRGSRLAVLKVDAADETNLSEVMRGHDAVLCALPYYFNFRVARTALSLGLHFADLGGNTAIVKQQETLHAEACARGISIIPDCGLAPGLVNVLAADAIERLDRARSAKLMVGGLPQNPEPPLKYTIVYSLEGTLDYYTTPSWVLRGGQPVQVEALSELERVVFPPPLGELEAFHTGGGISTMPWRYAGRVETMEYKTLRYPGHAEIMRAIRDLGLLDTEPVEVKGVPVVPRDLFIAAASPKLRRPQAHDLVALRVVVEGTLNGKDTTIGYQLIDRYDTSRGISAMMRTTGYSLSIVGQMLLDGRIAARGVKPAFEAVPCAPYLEELRKRGIAVEELPSQ